MAVANDPIAHERLNVPGMPDVPGLAFRRFRGEADYPRMLRVIAACAPVDAFGQIERRRQVCDLRQRERDQLHFIGARIELFDRDAILESGDGAVFLPMRGRIVDKGDDSRVEVVLDGAHE